MFEVVKLDPRAAGPERLAQVHGVLAACHDQTARGEPYRSFWETRAFLTYPPAGDVRCHWVAVVDDAVVGVSQISYPHYAETGRIDVHVGPRARRRGAGRALLDAAATAGRDAGLRSLVGRYATPAGAAFAARVGFIDGRRDVRSVIRVDQATLDPQPVNGYTLERWVGCAPSRLVASFAVAREAINDAPGNPDEERESFDADRVRNLEHAAALRDMQIHVTAACDDRGDVVAFTEIRVDGALGAVGRIEDTAVMRGHRNRGLARWVKTEALVSLRGGRPDVGLVATTNAENNPAIRVLNTDLGFTVETIITTATLKL